MFGKTADDYIQAAAAVNGVLARVSPDTWGGAGLGSWDLRALVGQWDERSTLVQLLAYVRTTAVHKCTGVSDVLAANAPLPGSPLMSLGGVLNHLRWVDHAWLDTAFLGGPDRACGRPAMAAHRPCAGCCCTSSRRRPGTTATWTSCARWPTAAPATKRSGRIRRWRR